LQEEHQYLRKQTQLLLALENDISTCVLLLIVYAYLLRSMYDGPGGHAMRRYLSANGDVKIDTSTKPIVRGPRYHAHTHSCGHVCAEKIQKIEKPTWWGT